MPRLFTGLELPDDVRDSLARLRMPIPGARWLEAGTLHLTLRFAGDIDNATAREFVHELASIDQPAFEVTIAGVGQFGGQMPRTLWAGVKTSEPLAALARAHERAARNAGLAPEKRAFTPHVTLARLQYPRLESLVRFLQRNATFEVPPIYVDRFVLFSSRPKTGGGPYVVEDEFPLQGAVTSDESW